MKAFLLAAGLGTRMRPLTDTVPKCLVTVDGTPLLDLWLERLAAAGVSEVLVNLHHLADRVTDHLARRVQPTTVRTVFEPTLLGSAGTLLSNRDFVDGEEMFLAVNADNLTDFDLEVLVEAHRSSRPVATLALFRAADPTSCGIVELQDGLVTAFEEKPSRPRSNLANAGLYAFSPTALDRIRGPLPRDIGHHLLPQLVGDARGIDIGDAYFRDIGTVEALEQANRDWPRPGHDAPRQRVSASVPVRDDTPRDAKPLLIATVAREEGVTGVHTHVRQLRRYVERSGSRAELLNPHEWARGRRVGGLVLLPLFGARVVLERFWGPGHVWWYRTSHRYFLRRVLQRRLRDAGVCTVYAQCPVAAEAALAARTGPEQRVVLAVHFGISQADEWVRKRQIKSGGRLYRSIRAAERGVVPAVDGLVFVSPWARQSLREWLPEVDEVEWRVIPNFVTAPAVEGARPSTVGDLVSVGNLDSGKNHGYLLEILSAARKQGHVYSLDIFGQGEDRQRLLRVVEELGLGKQVRLLGFHKDVQQRLPGYRAYAHTSRVETSSLAMMEAMAAGLPLLSSASGALADLFDEGVEGRFWPLDDPETAARVLIDLLEDPERLASAGRASRQRFLEDYDADAVAPQLLRFLDGPGERRLGTAAGLASVSSAGLPDAPAAARPSRSTYRAPGAAVGGGC